MVRLFEVFRSILGKEEEKTNKISNGDFSEITGLDIITEMFLNHSDIMEKELIPFFKNNIDNINLNEYFTLGYSRILKKEREGIFKKIQCDKTEKWYRPIIKCLDNKIQKIVSIKSFIDFEMQEFELYDFGNILNNEYKHINKKDGYDFIRENYSIFNLIKIFYKIYSNSIYEKKKFEYCCNGVVNTYKSYDIDILNHDEQLRNYKILTYTDDFEIHNTKESRTLYDKRIDHYFWVYVPRLLLKCFEKCIYDGLISNIAFKISDITKVLPAYEDLEIGAKFSFDIPSLPSVSKLYDIDDYDNGLWVKNDQNEGDLTFEEICSDFQSTDDSIITNVVHIKYSKNEKNEYIINHLDHEYIFYSIDEYEKRVKDSSIKGENRKRVKTFKIDSSKIPFTYQFEGKYALLICLDAFFSQKKLIQEYFENIN